MRRRVALGVCGFVVVGILVSLAAGRTAASELVRPDAPWPGLAPSAAAINTLGLGDDREASSASPRLPVPATGDINGDGLDDLVLYGDPGSLTPQPTWPIRVVFGKRDNAFVDVRAPGSWGYILDGPYGGVPSAVGDVNGDGRADMLVATARPGWRYRPTGAVVVLGQSATGTVTAGAPGSQFRIGGRGLNFDVDFRVFAVGDVNADGYDDLGALYFGQPRKRTRKAKDDTMWLIYGRAQPVDVDVDRLGRSGVRIRAPRPPARLRFFGTDLNGTGDINGDGIDDVAVGALWYPARSCVGISGVGTFCDGRVWVIYGRRRLPARIDAAKLGRRGLTIVANPGRLAPERRRFSEVRFAGAAGDLDNDGYNDLLLRAGSVVCAVVWGTPRTHHPRRVVLNARTSRLDGPTVPIGDFNGDGRTDLLGFRESFDYETDSNRPFVLLGHRWAGLRRVDPRRRAHGYPLFRNVGASGPPYSPGTTPVGDFNGDGLADLGPTEMLRDRARGLLVFGSSDRRGVSLTDPGSRGLFFGVP